MSYFYIVIHFCSNSGQVDYLRRLRSIQPFIINWCINRVPVGYDQSKGTRCCLCRWQVTLCDPIWHAASCSDAGASSTNCYTALPLLCIKDNVFSVNIMWHHWRTWVNKVSKWLLCWTMAASAVVSIKAMVWCMSIFVYLMDVKQSWYVHHWQVLSMIDWRSSVMFITLGV